MYYGAYSAAGHSSGSSVAPLQRSAPVIRRLHWAERCGGACGPLYIEMQICSIAHRRQDYGAYSVTGHSSGSSLSPLQRSAPSAGWSPAAGSHEQFWNLIGRANSAFFDSRLPASCVPQGLEPASQSAPVTRSPSSLGGALRWRLWSLIYRNANMFDSTPSSRLRGLFCGRPLVRQQRGATAALRPFRWLESGGR